MAPQTKPPGGEITLRPAEPAEAEVLSALAMESKAHWGYDAAFMEMCRDELRVTAKVIAAQTVVVASAGSEIAGYYSYEPDGRNGAEVTALFVRPDRMGRGIGSRLAADMRRRAGRSGLRTLAVDSDPYARKFYERQGFRYVGGAPSGSIPGRTLPRLVCALAPTGGTGINSRP